MKWAARIALGVVLLLLVAALAGVSSARGQNTTPPPDDFWCLPAEVSGGTGTRYEVFETAAISGRVGWCPNANRTQWKITVHQWCRKDVCSRLPLHATVTIAAAVDRILKATDKKAAVKAEWDTWKIANDTPLKEWEFKDWRHQACTWLTSTTGVTPRAPIPIEIPKANPTDIAFDFPLNWCDVIKPGPKPEQPAPAWRSVGGTLYKLTLGPPARLVSATTRKAPQNAACDPALEIPVGAKRFFRLVGGAPDEATECVK